MREANLCLAFQAKSLRYTTLQSHQWKQIIHAFWTSSKKLRIIAETDNGANDSTYRTIKIINSMKNFIAGSCIRGSSVNTVQCGNTSSNADNFKDIRMSSYFEAPQVSS